MFLPKDNPSIEITRDNVLIEDTKMETNLVSGTKYNLRPRKQAVNATQVLFSRSCNLIIRKLDPEPFHDSRRLQLTSVNAPTNDAFIFVFSSHMPGNF